MLLISVAHRYWDDILAKYWWNIGMKYRPNIRVFTIFTYLGNIFSQYCPILRCLYFPNIRRQYCLEILPKYWGVYVLPIFNLHLQPITRTNFPNNRCLGFVIFVPLDLLRSYWKLYAVVSYTNSWRRSQNEYFITYLYT